MKMTFAFPVELSLIKSVLFCPMVFCTMRARFVVVVVDDSLFDGPFKSGTHHSAAHAEATHANAGTAPAIAGMSKAADAVQNSFDTFKRQRPSCHPSCRLHRSTQKAWRPRLHRPILRIEILRLCER